jgi:sirohydrochlorin ferrochelatase
MSGTRSRSPKAPATEPGEALLIVAHGDCGGERANRLAGLIARRMRRSGRFTHVAVGYMRGTPGLAEAAAAIDGGEVRVCPLFMSDGYYVRRAIPARLDLDGEGADRSGRRFRIMQPTGLSDRLPAIIAKAAEARARSAGLAPAATRLLLAAHGSLKDPASRRAAERVAAAIREEGRIAAVTTAFLDEPPFLDEALASAPGPLIVAGLFIGDGLHGAEDLAAAAAAAGRPDLHLVLPLSRSPRLVAAICADIEQAA